MLQHNNSAECHGMQSLSSAQGSATPTLPYLPGMFGINATGQIH